MASVLTAADFTDEVCSKCGGSDHSMFASCLARHCPMWGEATHRKAGKAAYGKLNWAGPASMNPALRRQPGEAAPKRRDRTVAQIRLERLVQAALDVLHHDRDDDGPETCYNQQQLREKFAAILREPLHV